MSGTISLYIICGQHLFSAQDHGKPFGKFWVAQILHDFRTLQDFSVEELQGADIGFLHGGTGVLLRDQVEQKGADFLFPHLGRGTHEVFGKPAATAEMTLVGVRAVAPEKKLGFHLVVKFSPWHFLLVLGFES